MTKIIAQTTFNGQNLIADLHSPIDISLVLSTKKNARAWYVDLPEIKPVMTEQFTGSVADGGSVNFRNIFFNPHGHGTHTECVGHITKEIHSINDSLQRFFSVASVITIEPEILQSDDRWMKKGDRVISKHQLSDILSQNAEALVIRTSPNDEAKRFMNYSDTNPAYIHPDTMTAIANSDVRHLLLDLPSVDRESDEGQLLAHRIFWGVPDHIRHDRTITELIYIPNSVPDGTYLLELQVAPFDNDASPSRPVIYPLVSV